MNKMMLAAIRLYHKREKESIKDLFESISDGIPRKYNNSHKIWFWGLNRWGREFSFAEYDVRTGAK